MSYPISSVYDIPVLDIKVKGFQAYVLSKITIIWGILTVMLSVTQLDELDSASAGIIGMVGFGCVYLLHCRVVNPVYLASYLAYREVNYHGVVSKSYRLDINQLNNIIYVLNLPYKMKKQEINSCITMLYVYCSQNKENSNKLLRLLEKYADANGNVEITVSDGKKKYIVEIGEVN